MKRLIRLRLSSSFVLFCIYEIHKFRSLKTCFLVFIKLVVCKGGRSQPVNQNTSSKGFTKSVNSYVIATRQFYPIPLQGQNTLSNGCWVTRGFIGDFFLLHGLRTNTPCIYITTFDNTQKKPLCIDFNKYTDHRLQIPT